MFAISTYQGLYRIGKGTFMTPEDATFVGREPAKDELPQVQRAARAWSNDLENIPIFLRWGLPTSGLARLRVWLFGSS